MRVPQGIYPYGIARENTGPNSFSPNGYYPGSSLFVRMLPYFEQQVLANAYNYSLHNWVADNSTVGATGLNVLWCPSDGLIAGLHVRYAGWGWDGSDQILTYTSYAGSMGNFCKVPIHVTSPAQHQAVLNQADGLFNYLGWPQPGFAVQPNPLAPLDPGSVRPSTLASVTDGLSNTLAFGEKAHGKFSQVPDVYFSVHFHQLRRLDFRELRRHAVHDALSDESVRPDRRRPQPQWRLLLQLRQPGRQLLHRRFELPSRRLQFRVPRRLGSLPQGFDQRLALSTRPTASPRT